MTETIMIIGPAATGKSTVAERFTKIGYERINRDTIGGKIAGLLPIMEDHLRNGKNVILDNTHLTPEKREPFISLAKKHKSTIKCFFMSTPIEEAQINFCNRLISNGLNIDDMEAIKASDSPNIFPPSVIFQHFKDFVIPTLNEGFDSVIEVPFKREWGSGFVNKAILLDFDSTIRVTKSGNVSPMAPDDIEIMPNRKEVLSSYNDYYLLGVSNQSQIYKGLISYYMARSCYDKTIELLGLDVDYMFCPHASGVPSCFCRKPMVGFGVHFISKYKLNPQKCIMVGDMTSDETFAKRCGFQFIKAEEFFK